MPEAVKELADKTGLGDPETALEGLAKDGRLRPDSSGKRSRPVWIAKKKVRARSDWARWSPVVPYAGAH